MTPHFKTCLGLDVTADGILAVRATRSGTRVDVETVPWNPAMADRAAVAACLPASECFARRLTAPFGSVVKALKVFPSILDIQLPFPIEKCVYRFLDAAPAAGQVGALALAARHEEVSSRIEKLNQAGVDPTHLDHEGLALWTQSLEELPLDLETARAVFYLGPDRSTLVIGRGAKFIHAAGIRSGTRQYFDGDAPDAAALGQLAARVQQVLRAQVPDVEAQPMQWAFTGPGAEREAWTGALRFALRLPEATTVFTHKAVATFLARAVATRALADGPYRCNFRTDAFEHRVVAAARDQQQNRVAVTCLAAGLALCAVNLAWQGVLRAKLSSSQRAIETLAKDLSGLPRVPRGQEVLVVERALEECAPLVAPFARAFEPSSADLLAALLDEADPGRVTLDSATVGAVSIVLRGSAVAWGDGESLADVLRSRGWNVNLERGDAGSDDRVPFTIKAVL
ncbi:MAG: hypothetical protein V1929_08705 [bacterium]